MEPVAEKDAQEQAHALYKPAPRVEKFHGGIIPDRTADGKPFVELNKSPDARCSVFIPSNAVRFRYRPHSTCHLNRLMKCDSLGTCEVSCRSTKLIDIRCVRGRTKSTI
jgi:hypothetical protein